MTERWRERLREREKGCVQGMLWPKLELAQCHFDCILLSKASHRLARFKGRGNRFYLLHGRRNGKVVRSVTGQRPEKQEAVSQAHQCDQPNSCFFPPYPFLWSNIKESFGQMTM